MTGGRLKRLKSNMINLMIHFCGLMDVLIQCKSRQTNYDFIKKIKNLHMIVRHTSRIWSNKNISEIQGKNL